MTGPRKRTLQLVALCIIGAVITGGTAESSKTRRSRGALRSQGTTHRGADVRAKKLHSTSVKKQKQATGKSHRTRIAQEAIQRSSTVGRRTNRSRSLVAQRSRERAVSRGTWKQFRRQAWLNQRWRHPVPTNLRQSPPPSSSHPPIQAVLERRAAMLGALPPGSGLGSLLGEGETSTPGADNQDLVREALAARGIRYRWGGMSRRGFDCSGFTSYLYRRMRGVQLPHSASRQARHGKKVALHELREGDLVFFHTYRRGISHVGLYIGGNRFVHAANSRRRVRVDELSGYYLKRFVTARRLNSTATARPFGTGEPPSSNEEMPPVEIPEQIPDLKPEMPSDTVLAMDKPRATPREADETPSVSVETGSQ